eukprot:3941181-Rhodomonas_salina.1
MPYSKGVADSGAGCVHVSTCTAHVFVGSSKVQYNCRGYRVHRLIPCRFARTLVPPRAYVSAGHRMGSSRAVPLASEVYRMLSVSGRTVPKISTSHLIARAYPYTRSGRKHTIADHTHALCHST